MPQTTVPLPICIHCGTPRPADETLCPQCGKPWIDVQIAKPPASTGHIDPAPAAQTPPPIVIDPDPAPATEPLPETQSAPTASVPPPPVPTPPAPTPPVPPAPAPAPPIIPIDDTGEFGMDEWTLPPDPPSSKAIWLLPVALVVAVIAFWSFVYFRGNTPATTTTTTLETTTTESTTTTIAEVVEETTTTASTTTTTTVPFPPASDWTASGDPIPADALVLKAAGIGPLEFGAKLGDVAGRLVATLGEAGAAGDSNLCPPAEQYLLQWGNLTAIFDGWEPDATFVSYRYEAVEGADGGAELATASGLRLGQTVAQLKSTYPSYTVSFELIDGQDHFRLVDGGDLLLWGPVSSTENDGTVLGIFSPSPCP